MSRLQCVAEELCSFLISDAYVPFEKSWYMPLFECNQHYFVVYEFSGSIRIGRIWTEPTGHHLESHLCPLSEVLSCSKICPSSGKVHGLVRKDLQSKRQSQVGFYRILVNFDLLSLYVGGLTWAVLCFFCCFRMGANERAGSGSPFTPMSYSDDREASDSDKDLIEKKRKTPPK